MIGYVTLGTNDMPRALAFYDGVAAVLGAARIMSGEKFSAYGTDVPALGICLPFNGEPATIGNGTMVALTAASRAQVDAVHAKALELGGSCEGKPGLRGGEESNFYAAYFRDLDGNKIAVARIGPAD